MTSRPETAADPTRTRRALAISMGERLRQLRVSAGMTQSELAGDRFSKEYVSQIERGKTRPTAETIEWLAARLGVDSGFLANGVSADARGRVETILARAEALTEAHQVEEALALYDDARTAVAATGLPELEARLLSGVGRARLRAGDPRKALEALTRARELSEGPGFSDVERADVLYHVGVARYMLSSISTAIGLLTQALELAERSGMPCDLLRSSILHYRSRCYRRQRDYEAAREDVELALELAEGVSDRRTIAHLYFQASLLAEREGHWVLARNYAERAKAQYEEISDRANVGRLLNNLGGLNFLLGKPDDAIRYLTDAFATALEVGNETDAAYAVTSIAQVRLQSGEYTLAEEQALHALRLLETHPDALDTIGAAQLALGRSLLEQDRLDEAEVQFTAALASFDQLSSASHRASAWVAQGDLAARRGDDRGAARLYRLAAETLQDVRF
jgi:transcriptional regulator with XRE-family HTH domain/Tfp pilus assembly protein PilF